MKKPALVVFDIAGTPVSDPGIVAKSFIDAFADAGYDIHFEETQSVMGYKKTDAVARAFGLAEDRLHSILS